MCDIQWIFKMHGATIKITNYVYLLTNHTQQTACPRLLTTSFGCRIKPSTGHNRRTETIGTPYLREGADTNLARPGRKQDTANKFGIYSTYSPRSSIHFWARYSNFCKPQKKVQKGVRPTRSPRQQWPPRLSKNADLSIVFPVQGTGGSPTGTDTENRVGDQDTGTPGRPVSSG